MARRANGEGTIYRLPDGRWRGIVSVRVGTKLQRKTCTRQKRGDVVANMDRLKAELTGVSTADSTSKLTEYLDQWLANIVKPHAEETTYVLYEYQLRLHIKPRFPTTKLARLTPMQMEAFKNAMIADGVGKRAAQSAFQTLRRALETAVYPLRLIQRNPCDGIKSPKHSAKEMKPFEAVEARKIIDSAVGTGYQAFYAMAFGCGLRFGELCGLQWGDIEWQARKVNIKRQAVTIAGSVRVKVPKTSHSVRTVDVPENVIEHLTTHRALRLRQGLAGHDCLVFGTKHGTPYKRGNFYAQEWRSRLSDLKLTHRGIHNTRHTFATLAIQAGVPIPVVSKALGHASPATTMKIYAHVLKSAENGAAIAMERLLG